MLSASTDVGGPVNKYTIEYSVSKQEPRFPVLANNAISALIALDHWALYRPIVSQEWKKLSSCNLQHGCSIRSSTLSLSVC